MYHLLLYFFLSIFLLIQSTGSNACIDVERAALFAFKSKLQDPSNLLSTWKGLNCCDWKGVTCHNNTGHVLKLNLRYCYPEVPKPYMALTGKIDPSLLSLEKLMHLDLSCNNFNETKIPNFIGQFENLVYLNLSSTRFIGKIPAEIGNLKRLRVLDLSQIYFGQYIPPELGNISTLSFLSLGRMWYTNLDRQIENFQWISKLSSLQHLDLSYIDLSSTNWFDVINKLKYLKVLILLGCNLYNIPAHVAALNFTGLTTLDLSSNSFQSPVPSWLGNLTSISYLDLSYPISDFDGFLMGFLGLSNGFWHNLEENICRLRHLDLSSVNITGDVTDFVKKISCSWKTIEFLSLGNNNFHGSLQPDWLAKMPHLEHLDLRQNSIIGSLPNQIASLTKLNYMDLSSNHLEGIVSQNLLEHLTQLQVLHLSFNMLNIVIDRHWLPKFQLTELALQSCVVGPMFPLWLRSQTQIISLNLQNTSIEDALPPWFWRPSYQYIDLSHNSLRGMLPHSLQSPNLRVLILASNNLEGPIKSMPHDLGILDISYNRFSGTLWCFSNQSQLDSFSIKNNLFIGEIPSSICEMSSLGTLDLSVNNLTGTIPNCLSKLALSTLDMSFNNLSGNIPNSIGYMSSLSSLSLYGNSLTGELPIDLQYCTGLIFLSLGNNKLTGKLPPWIGLRLKYLVYLQLRVNNFNGIIPFEITLLSNLQVLDIANNNFEGSIPDSLGNFSAMASVTNSQYYTQIFSGMGYDDNDMLWYNYTAALPVFMKGEVLQYSKTLYLVNSIDLSGNNLSGFIPDSIVTLKALVNLNLYRNNLNGKIPEKIGNMKALESLDLSFNKFSGEVPQSMSELTFLGHLNLSYNNLSGPIPVGNQLNSLNDSSIYIGNVFLCGGPLNRSCTDRNAKNIISGGKSSNLHTLWLYISASAGFLVGWWGVWCILLLHRTWSACFYDKVDYLYYKLFK